LLYKDVIKLIEKYIDNVNCQQEEKIEDIKTNESYSAKGICEKCGKPKYHIGDPVSEEFLESYLCHCELLEKIKEDLFEKYKDAWEQLAKQ